MRVKFFFRVGCIQMPFSGVVVAVALNLRCCPQTTFQEFSP